MSVTPSGAPFELGFDFRTTRYRDAMTGLEALGIALEKEWQGQVKTLSIELVRFMSLVIEAMRQRHGAPWPAGTTTQTLAVRSGKLRASLKFDVSGETFDTLMGSITVPAPYGIHEFGGVIKAKKAKFLTIPLPAALDSRGVPLKPRARDWKNTFIARSKAGNLLIFRRLGAKVIPLYVLKPSVKIPARLGLRATMQTGLPYFVDRAVDAMVKDMVKKVTI